MCFASTCSAGADFGGVGTSVGIFFGAAAHFGASFIVGENRSM